MFKRIVCALALMVVCFTAPMSASAEMTFHPNPEHAGHSGWMAVETIFSDLITRLNSEIRNYPNVPVELKSCNAVNAYYMPKRGDGPYIVFCKELVEFIYSSAQRSHNNPQAQALSASSQITFILTHELGHALIDLLELPITGREEDAVDQLASVILEDSPEMTSYASAFWATQSQGRHSREQYAGEHGLNEQRYYNILCWAYGADPLIRFEIGRKVPANRRGRCENEALSMTRAWKRILGEHLSPTIGTLANRRNLSGTWRFAEQLASADGNQRCTASGTLKLQENLAGTMAHEGNCIIKGGDPSPNNINTPIEGVTRTDDGFTFRVGSNCFYTAQYEDVTRFSVRGEVRCGEATGSFFATR